MTDIECENLIRGGLHALFASIDGVSQPVHEKYRVRGKVSRVFANLDRLRAAKNRLNAENFLLGWQYHVSAYAEHEMEAPARKAAQLGIGIVFKRLTTPDLDWQSLRHQQAQMMLKGAAWFNKAYNPPQNPDFKKISLHHAVAPPCAQLFGTMTINWYGDGMPCTCVEGPDYSMGNLLSHCLAEVWPPPRCGIVRSSETVAILC